MVDLSRSTTIAIKFLKVKNLISNSVHLKDGYYNNQMELNPDAPDVVAVGPKIGGINPAISLTIKDVGR